MQAEVQKSECRAVIGSLTQAIRAQRILASAAIYSNVEKITSAQTKRGCEYGVRYACGQEAAVYRVLRKAGIRARGEGGG